MIDWIILADDLTGACDTGAAFAQAGFRTRVVLPGSEGNWDDGRTEVLVFSTESRYGSSDNARITVRTCLSRVDLQQVGRVYKKIDSTLRGHPGIELAETARISGLSRSIVTPAFPSQGRTVSGGLTLVNGILLEETAFGAEVLTGDLRQHFIVDQAAPVCLKTSGQAESMLVPFLNRASGVIVADAETDDDLMALARAGLHTGIRLFCGSAGLARALAAVLEKGNPRHETVRPSESISALPVIAAAGSRSTVTTRQVDRLLEEGWQAFESDDFRIDKVDDKICEEACWYLQKGRPVVAHAGRSPYLPGFESTVSAQIAGVVARLLACAQVSGLLLTGGDTAAAVLRALGCSAVELGGEVQPGIAWGRMLDGQYAGLMVVTKAGGFGGEDALLQAARFCQKEPGLPEE